MRSIISNMKFKIDWKEGLILFVMQDTFAYGSSKNSLLINWKNVNNKN